ncbi:hypothetical protein [Cupriavidus campinensis]|uniref:hypothetical protein n=1 Tax=Cupriavidus campinensis TaxID=151783 RepID=UPI0011EC9B4D|nr:hypothetical protein [Cupriavidus campinensis]
MAIPDSFALNLGGQVVLQDAGETAGPATRIDGAASTAVPRAVGAELAPTDWNGIAQTGLRSLEAVNKLADNVLKPYVERLEKQQYFEGMSKVVQGQTLQQIEKDEPWYMQVFGPSATVRGAQAMTATTALQQAETDFMSNMDSLRRQSPDQVRQFLVQQATNLGNTGDPLVDATVQSKLAESWGPMLKTHMREHLAWQQQDMLDKQTNLNLSIGNGMRAQRNANSTGWDPAEKEAAYANAVAAAAPAPGQTTDSWNKGMAQTLVASLQNGNFDHYEAIKASPLWNQINVKVREQIEENMPQFVMKDAHQNPAITGITNNLAGFEFTLTHGSSGITTERELDAHIDQYNDKFSQRTGAGSPLIDNAKRAALHKQWLAGQEAMKRAAASAAAADGKYVDSANFASTAFATGNYSTLKGLELDRKAVADTMNEAFDREVGSNDPKRITNYFRRAAQVSVVENMRSPKLEQMLQIGVNGFLTGGSASPTKEQIQALAWAGALYQSGDNGPEALVNYLGADKAAKVAGFLNSGTDLNDPKEVVEYRVAMQKGRPDISPTGDERKKVRSVIQSENPGWLKQLVPFIGGPGMLSKYKLTDETVTNLEKTVAPDAVRYATAYNVPLETATKIKLADTLKNADLLPGAIIPAQGNVQGDRSLSTAVNRLLPGVGVQSTEVYQTAVQNVINSQLTAGVKAAGADMSNFSTDDYAIRSGQQVGNGMLAVFMFPKDATKAATLGPTMVSIMARPVADEIARLTKERGTRKGGGTASSPTHDPQGFEARRREAMHKAGLPVD